MQIKAYTLSTCAFCWAFKQFMAQHDIPFDFVDVDLLVGGEREAVISEAQKLCPGCGYPIIVINGEVVRGFDEPRLREVLGL